MNATERFQKMKEIQMLQNRLNENDELLSLNNFERLHELIQSTEKDIISKIETNQDFPSNELIEALKIDHIPLNIASIKQINDDHCEIKEMNDPLIISRLIQFAQKSDHPNLQNQSINIPFELIMINPLNDTLFDPSSNKIKLHSAIKALSYILGNGRRNDIRDKLLEKGLIKQLTSICRPNQPIEIIEEIAHIMVDFADYEFIPKNQISELFKFASITIIYDIDTILEPALRLFANQIYLNDGDISLKSILHGVDNESLKNEIEEKSKCDELTVFGYISNDMVVPPDVTKLILRYYTPFSIKSKIENIQFNIYDKE